MGEPVKLNAELGISEPSLRFSNTSFCKGHPCPHLTCPAASHLLPLGPSQPPPAYLPFSWILWLCQGENGCKELSLLLKQETQEQGHFLVLFWVAAGSIFFDLSVGGGQKGKVSFSSDHMKASLPELPSLQPSHIPFHSNFEYMSQSLRGMDFFCRKVESLLPTVFSVSSDSNV